MARLFAAFMALMIVGGVGIKVIADTSAPLPKHMAADSTGQPNDE